MADQIEYDSPDESVGSELDTEDEEGFIARARKRRKEQPREMHLDYPNSLPYECESLEEMDKKLEDIISHLTAAVDAKDYDVGMMYWSYQLQCWLALKYPIKRELRAGLIKLFYEVAVTPAFDPRFVHGILSPLSTLLESKKRVDIWDLQLPWRPLYDVLYSELFPKGRRIGLTDLPGHLLNLCEKVQRFFPPHETTSMLETFLPRFDGAQLDSILAAQSFMVHFLPLTHPQDYLPAVFRLWESFSSSLWDDQWFDFVARLAEIHMDRELSDPRAKAELKRAAEKEKERDQGVTESGSAEKEKEKTSKRAETPKLKESSGEKNQEWQGIRRDVGIFTDLQWALMMTKALRAMGVPVGSAKAHASFKGGAAVNGASADGNASSTSRYMIRRTNKLRCIASTIIYSMAEDSPRVASVGMTPGPSAAGTPGTATPVGKPAPPTGKIGATLGEELNTGVRGAKTTESGKTPAYLGGSKALDSLGKLIQATESYFHPSNFGTWTPILAKFANSLALLFLTRWREEELPSCTTPKEWRLTKEIRKQFVLTLRQAGFLSMFAKEHASATLSVVTLKYLAYLEPELILEPILERAYPALEGLLEPHRTTACLNALGQVAIPLLSRDIYPAGAKHLVPLLELCVPGLDINDLSKTMYTSMFVLSSFSVIRAADYTVFGDDTPMLGEDGMIVDQPEGKKSVILTEEDELVKLSTAGFPEWVEKWFRQVLLLLDNLPERGRNNRAGGKSEESASATLLAACDVVIASLSEPLFDIAFDIFYDYVSTTVRTNSVGVIDHLGANFARANPEKVMARLVPLCDMMIRRELDFGAASTRTTSTSPGGNEDISLVWFSTVLFAVTRYGGAQLHKHEGRLLDLLKLMIEKIFSEQCYSLTTRILASIIHSLSSVYSLPLRPFNADEWDDPELERTGFLKWGKRYESKEVKLEWHVPTQDEIRFTFRLICEILEPALKTLENLLADPTAGEGHVWKNDFCRYATVVRGCVGGLGSLIHRDVPDTPGSNHTDTGHEVPGFAKNSQKIACGIIIKDSNDPRHKEFNALLRRFGLVLNGAVQALETSAKDDSIDVVRLVLRSIETLMLSYPASREYFSAAQQVFTFCKNAFKPTTKDKALSRVYWVRRIDLYHQTRRRHVPRARPRSDVDDLLIRSVVELACSDYTRIRKNAQKLLDSITAQYDGTKQIVLERLYDVLATGTPSSDGLKGALYVLRSKPYLACLVSDWSIGSKVMLALPRLASQEKASVQELVKTFSHELFVRIHEPVTTRVQIQTDGLKLASIRLQQLVQRPQDLSLDAELCKYATERMDRLDNAWTNLVPELLAVATDPTTHWSYKFIVTKFLLAVMRRDRPSSPEIAAFFAENSVASMQDLQQLGIRGTMVVLHTIKLRSLCSNNVSCLLNKSSNPLKRVKTLQRPLGDDFTERFIESFRTPIGLTNDETLLVDRSYTGWLVWGESIECYAAPPQTETVLKWEEASGPTISRLREILTSQNWWQTLVKLFSQESSRSSLSSDHVQLIKSIFQIFEDDAFDVFSPIIDKLLGKNERDSQRAGAEFLSGLIRGMKHWPLAKQQRVWDWLAPQLPKILEGATQETLSVWESWISQCLVDRDPRRCQPLVDYLTGISLEDHQDHPSMQSKAHYQVGSAMGAMSWRFLPWANKFLDQYWDAIDHSYSEVRTALAGNLRSLSEDRLHPSYSSCDAFLRDCREKSDDVSLLDAADPPYVERIEQLKAKLVKWRGERLPAYQGSQTYDRACGTIMTWMWSGLTDHRVTLMYPFAQALLQELFHMQELIDNEELTAYAASVLGALAACQYPREMVRSTATSLLDILRSSTSWRVRIDLLPFLQVFYFRQLFLIDDDIVSQVMEQLCTLLQDPVVDVREAAAATLSGIIRCSQRGAILSLKARFLKTVKTVRIPKRRQTNGEETLGWKQAVNDAHAGVLGACALIDAFPYEVPKWMPDLLLETGVRHKTSPAPIKQTVERCLKDFKKTHQDSWNENKKSFTHDQLMTLQDLLTGSTYYA